MTMSNDFRSIFWADRYIQRDNSDMSRAENDNHSNIDFMNRDDDAKSIYAPAGLSMSIRLERDGRNGKWCVVLIARFRQKLKPY